MKRGKSGHFMSSTKHGESERNMNEMLRTFRKEKQTAWRFAVVGASNTIVDFVVFFCSLLQVFQRPLRKSFLMALG